MRDHVAAIGETQPRESLAEGVDGAEVRGVGVRSGGCCAWWLYAFTVLGYVGSGWRGVVQLPSWDEGVCDEGWREGELRRGCGGHGGKALGGGDKMGGGSWLFAIWVSGEREGLQG